MGGETSLVIASPTIRPQMVHPRVGGETIRVPCSDPVSASRVHPRVGGETPNSGVRPVDEHDEGPSPRGRGNQLLLRGHA